MPLAMKTMSAMEIKKIGAEMNEFEILLVQKDLEEKGYINYKIQPGNDCVWASVMSGAFCLDFYYIFREGRLVDVQVD